MHSVRWSTPREIILQIWEWKPLQNIRLFTETYFDAYPPLASYYAFLVITIVIISSTSAFIIYQFSIKLNFQRENEILNIIRIDCYTQKRQAWFPSPNYRQKCKANWFRLIPWVKFTLCLNYVTPSKSRLDSFNSFIDDNSSSLIY